MPNGTDEASDGAAPWHVGDGNRVCETSSKGPHGRDGRQRVQGGLERANLDSKVANLTSCFQCGQSGEDLENKFAELSARLEAEHGYAHTRNPGEVRGAWRIQLQDGDHVEHFSVTQATRGILQGLPGARRWNGASGRQAKSFVSRVDCAEKPRSVHWMMSRKVNLAKLGSRQQNRLLGGPSDYRRLR